MSPLEKRFGFPRSLRIVETSSFGAIARTRNEKTFRVHSTFFSAGCMENDAVGRLRFGVTVGKRNAHRSVDRATVKRILREAARQNAASLKVLLDDSGKPLGLDVSLRLKAPIASAGLASAHTARKLLLAQDAKKLLELVAQRMRGRYKSDGGLA